MADGKVWNIVAVWAHLEILRKSERVRPPELGRPPRKGLVAPKRATVGERDRRAETPAALARDGLIRPCAAAARNAVRVARPSGN